jgi:hypothetical protein
MSDLKAAAQQALEALENCASEHGHRCSRCDSEVDEGGRVVTALRAALAQETQTPCDIAEDGVCEVIDCCRNSPQEEQDSWQPIATAPKTGRKVILFYLNRNSLPRTVMARWVTDEEAAETDGEGVGLEAGWYECIDNWDEYTEVAIYEGEPTHWMPLPEAPRKEEA